jgi:hypothetical protein
MPNHATTSPMSHVFRTRVARLALRANQPHLLVRLRVHAAHLAVPRGAGRPRAVRASHFTIKAPRHTHSRRAKAQAANGHTSPPCSHLLGSSSPRPPNPARLRHALSLDRPPVPNASGSDRRSPREDARRGFGIIAQDDNPPHHGRSGRR